MSERESACGLVNTGLQVVVLRKAISMRVLGWARFENPSMLA